MSADKAKSVKKSKEEERLVEHQSELLQIKDELEELISLLAQTSDSTIVNLTTRFEKFEADLEERDSHRWSLFKWIVGIIVIAITTLLPVFYVGIEKFQSGLNEHAKKIIAIETNISDHVTKKDLLEAIEKRFTQLETHMKEAVTLKELEKLKSEILQVIMRSREKDGGRNQ